MTVLAFVGPRPLYSWSVWTISREMSALTEVPGSLTTLPASAFMLRLLTFPDWLAAREEGKRRRPNVRRCYQGSAFEDGPGPVGVDDTEALLPGMSLGPL